MTPPTATISAAGAGGRIDKSEVIRRLDVPTYMHECLGKRITRHSGRQIQAQCPWHDDQLASLSINAETGSWMCHAGCGKGSIFDFDSRVNGGDWIAGLKRLAERAGLAPSQRPQKRIARTYNYVDETGTILYQTCRMDPKDFRQRRPGANGDWVWDLQGARRILYRLPEVLSAETVYVTEGEKDADALAAIGLCGTTNVCGAGKWRPEFSEHLVGKNVVILPDNDEPGRRHAEDVARSVHGKACSVKIVELPGLPNKGDISDWLAAGGNKEDLFALTEATGQYVLSPSSLFEMQSERFPSAPVSSGGPIMMTWKQLDELPGGLLPVPRFPEKIIPENLRPWIVDIAERFQCPLEFVAVGALVILGAAVGRSIGIRPKRFDDWTVVPNLWGGIVGRPGIMKSPALSEVMKPLHRLDAKAREEFDAAAKRYEIEKAIAKVERDAEIRAAAKDGDKKARLLGSAACSEPTPPTARRYIVNDSTVEKLGEILNANPRGVLLFRDELTGWLRTLDREGHEGDRAFYLESWNGTGSFTYDRIGRGTVHIPAACVSVLGGIQPGPLGDYLRACVKGGVGDDGLMQRFQLLVYPDSSTTWRNVDRRPDIEARNRAWEIIERLASADPHTSMSAEPGEIPFHRFDDEAQALFDEWRSDLERKIRSGEEAPVLESHLAKFRSLMPSLALLFHLAETVGGGIPGPVTAGAAEMAAAWCELLEAHARRIYQSVTERHHVAARLLGQKIRGGKLPDPFTARDVYLKGWGGLDAPEEVIRAAEVLDAAGWVRSETRQPAASGGRPSTAYHVNPEVLKVLKVPTVGVLGENGGQS